MNWPRFNCKCSVEGDSSGAYKVFSTWLVLGSSRALTKDHFIGFNDMVVKCYVINDFAICIWAKSCLENPQFITNYKINKPSMVFIIPPNYFCIILRYTNLSFTKPRRDPFHLYGLKLNQNLTDYSSGTIMALMAY